VFVEICPKDTQRENLGKNIQGCAKAEFSQKKSLYQENAALPILEIYIFYDTT
jgi:hypothetical protein